jgi:dCTP diphosphatase
LAENGHCLLIVSRDSNRLRDADLRMEPTLADLQERLRAFRDERDWRQFHSPKELAAAIAIEAAELQEFFLWTDPEEAARVAQNKREGVEAELADVLIQCL